MDVTINYDEGQSKEFIKELMSQLTSEQRHRIVVDVVVAAIRASRDDEIMTILFAGIMDDTKLKIREYIENDPYFKGVVKSSIKVVSDYMPELAVRATAQLFISSMSDISKSDIARPGDPLHNDELIDKIVEEVKKRNGK